jgi:hypothetical protein
VAAKELVPLNTIQAGTKLVPSFGHMVKMTHQQQPAFTVTLFNYDEPLQ